jgi:hypothetical protein
MYLVLLLALAVLFPAVHILNGWLFDFATINHHISLIYLPAFLRLFNLLVLGPIYGTLTTLLGGAFLMGKFEESLTLSLFNVACSSAGPLIALFGFKLYFKRRVELTSVRDLTTLTLIYCACNSLIHHGTWQILDTTRTFDVQAAMWMFVGDFNGALLGAYLMKAMIDTLERLGFNFSDASSPRN